MQRFNLTFLILMVTYSYSQTLNWLKSEPYPTFATANFATVNDHLGNVYSVSNSGYEGFHIIKYGSNGQTLWKKHYTGGWADLGSVSMDKTNHLFVNLFVAPSLAIEGKKYHQDYGRQVTIRYNPDGTVNWIKQGKEISLERIILAKYTDQGDELFSTGGYTYSQTISGNFLPNPSNISNNIYIGHLDTLGTPTWALAKEGGQHYIPKLDAYYYYIQDYSQFGVILGTGTNTVYVQPSQYYLAKYSHDGDLKYLKNFLSIDGTPDYQGNYMLMDFTPQGNDAKLTKVDPLGNVLWNKSKISAGKWMKTVMSSNSKGEVFLIGGASGFLEVDAQRTDLVGMQMFLVKWDNNGNLISVITSSGPGNATIRDIAVEGDKIWIGGEVGGTITFGGLTITESQGGIFTAQLIDDNNIVSISENKTNSTYFGVYPNPGGRIFHVRTNQPYSQLRVLNMLGQVVREYENTETVDLSGVPVGSYFLQAIFDDSIETKKIIVQ